MRLSNRFLAAQNTLFFRLLTYLANAQWLKHCCRKLMQILPFVPLQSDVSQVLYLNWLIPIENAKTLVPDGITLTEHEGQTLLTVLSYRHGGFAPKFLGKIRALFPSPQQSNWRFYVQQIDDQAPEIPHVLFIKNIFDNPVYTLATRLFSDALPSHLSLKFQQSLTDPTLHPQHIFSQVDAGQGSAASYLVEGYFEEQANLPAAFANFYSSWPDAVQHITQQDAAIAWIADLPELAQATIRLSFAQSDVRPVTINHFEAGEFLTALGATALPFAFYIPKLTFDVIAEQKLASTK